MVSCFFFFPYLEKPVVPYNTGNNLLMQFFFSSHHVIKFVGLGIVLQDHYINWLSEDTYPVF